MRSIPGLSLQDLTARLGGHAHNSYSRSKLTIPPALHGPEEKQLVLHDWPADSAARLILDAKRSVAFRRVGGQGIAISGVLIEVAAGIERVVYIEPYPKSQVADLFPDTIAVDSPGTVDRVTFEPFVGVAPRRYTDMFTKGERRKPDGRVLEWNRRTAAPRLAVTAFAYLYEEQVMFEALRELMDEKSAILNPASQGGGPPNAT